MEKIISVLIALILLFPKCSTVYAYPIVNTGKPLVDKSQAIQFAEDRNATKEFVHNIDYVYEYSQLKNIDPSIVVAISCLETGFGKSRLYVEENNPGGIKSPRGWRTFDHVRDGYRYMIDLFAIYGGVSENKQSYLFGKAKTIKELGNYYWVESGVDKGYYEKVMITISAMRSYDIIESNTSSNHMEFNALEFIWGILSSEPKPAGMGIILNILRR